MLLLSIIPILIFFGIVLYNKVTNERLKSEPTNHIDLPQSNVELENHLNDQPEIQPEHKSFSSFNRNENFTKTFSGSINNQYQIEMILTKNYYLLVGDYKYGDKTPSFHLKGSVDDNGAISLTEYDQSNEVTGYFRGNLTNESIEGNWKSADGQKSYPFSLTLLSDNSSLESPKIESILVAESGDSFNSLKYSENNDLLFVTSYPVDTNHGGRLIVLDGSNNIKTAFHFTSGGKVILDADGSLGAFMGEDKIARIFDRKNFVLLDSVTVPDLYGFKNIWFTKAGIIVCGMNSNFSYDIKARKLSEITELKSYHIFDYEYVADKLLIGLWDESFSGWDVKINTVFLSTSLSPSKKKLLLKTPSFILDSFFMREGSQILCVNNRAIYGYDINLSKQFTFSHSNSNVSKISEAIVTLHENPQVYLEFPSAKELRRISIDMAQAGKFVRSESRQCDYYLSVGQQNSIIRLPFN